jgi:hypothetical protein
LRPGRCRNGASMDGRRGGAELHLAQAQRQRHRAESHDKDAVIIGRKISGRSYMETAMTIGPAMMRYLGWTLFDRAPTTNIIAMVTRPRVRAPDRPMGNIAARGFAEASLY